MAFFSQMCFSLFLLHAILVTSSTQSSALTSQKSEDLIRQTCKRTNNFNLCVTSLNSDPRSLNADVKGLARISLQQLLTKTNQTLQNVGNLFKDTRDPIMFRLLGNCIIEYNRAVTDYLPGAISALDSNNYGASKQGADDTATSATTCGDQFIIRGLPRVSISTQSKQVQGLAMVASGIISTLG
ncbi:cell wall / vacuolar inhibitor of fructosidase 2-like [Camellia sinensis]|uniref:cell wall / vacuolar inhibitor of fructosidase 2-like n=1 Tax=Camellia sinensis TaxID=4442 RepID=UPI0010357079|nr:cell wall / vacuolar inhibitor of fructosidase 2-like [Camellia sinensis]